VNETERFFALRPVLARCRCCGQLLAEYLDRYGWSTRQRSCSCDRQPSLPDGAELAGLIARASRRDAQVTIRR
jgi:hypothetical protein